MAFSSYLKYFDLHGPFGNSTLVHVGPTDSLGSRKVGGQNKVGGLWPETRFTEDRVTVWHSSYGHRVFDRPFGC